MVQDPTYQVRAVHCDHRVGEEEVYQALRRAADPLGRAWHKIEAARRITLKFNAVWPSEQRLSTDGYWQEIVDPRVARATLRLLRERNPNAEILCPESSPEARRAGLPLTANVAHLDLLNEFRATLVEADRPPHKVCAVPGGGVMFRQYLLPESVVETDAFVSVSKMKNHAFMGVTLCLKNLFGLPPQVPLGRSRSYFHHLIRLSYLLVDLGRIAQPALNIVDGLVGQAGDEWGGEGRIADTLIAGDQVIATDACGTHLMGFDPLGDWPNPPFYRDRNPILIAHQCSLGTADLRQIDFQSEVHAPVAQFHGVETDPFDTVLAWRRSTCEQALYYRDHQRDFVDRYAGEFILIQDYEVRWHNTQSELGESRRRLAGPNKLSAMWMKYVDPEEAEGEHFEVYEQVLDGLRAWQNQDLGRSR